MINGESESFFLDSGLISWIRIELISGRRNPASFFLESESIPSWISIDYIWIKINSLNQIRSIFWWSWARILCLWISGIRIIFGRNQNARKWFIVNHNHCLCESESISWIRIESISGRPDNSESIHFWIRIKLDQKWF